MSGIPKSVMRYSFFAGAAVACAMLLMGRLAAASGLMTGVIWSVINFSLTIRLFDAALQRKDPKMLYSALLVKFPVLYLAGFLLLQSRIFPVMSLLAGIGITLITIGVVSIWPKRS